MRSLSGDDRSQPFQVSGGRALIADVCRTVQAAHLQQSARVRGPEVLPYRPQGVPRGDVWVVPDGWLACIVPSPPRYPQLLAHAWHGMMGSALLLGRHATWGTCRLARAALS